MPNHTVEQGEHISSIAERFGFTNFLTVWNHPANVELRGIRKNPHVLLPGDLLFIPVKEPGRVNAPTTRVHTFQIKVQTLRLRVLIQNVDASPITDTTVSLQVGNQANREPVKKGMLEKNISRSAHDGKIELADDHIPMGIGDLDPVNAKSGQLARLMNLGYYRRAMEPLDQDEWKSAVEEFQCDNDIKPVTGICDPVTQAKLEEVHGC